ncbi:MAG: hypothetical protein KBD06_01505 [Candidatus Pacebacteria bacterium]|nr:hypothetical protein [Candidatus Paceibacterota bacterium]
MYGKAMYAFAVVVVIALGAAFFVWQSSQSAGKIYKNSVHKYELSYPAELDVKEYTDDIATIGIVSDEAVDGRADIRVITAQGEAGQTLQDAVADQLKNLCAADGPTSSLSCTGTLSTEPYATENGDAGFVLMLNAELKDITSGTVENIPYGPYYVLPITTSATISSVLVIMPPLNLSAAQADAELLKAIAESVYLTK